jgi:hypothetical protein
MIPGPWTGVVLALAVYRLCRAAGWDTFPPLVWLRARITGEYAVNRGSTNTRMGVTNEHVQQDVDWKRPRLHDFIVCPFCLGFWLSVLVYAGWRLEPGWTVAVLFPFAVSAVAGLIALRLD